MAMTLRPYQTQLVADMRAGLRGAPAILVVLPTGGGKTVIASFVAESSAGRGRRSLFLVHRQRLVTQTSLTFDQFGIRHGLISRGHSMTDDPVQIGMVQTVARRLNRVIPPDLIFVDEAHHTTAGSWRKVIDAFPDAARVGLTATPERLDGKGLNDCYSAIVEGPPMRELIQGGFLAPYEYLAPPQVVDLSAVHTRAGDFATDELAVAMDKAVITGDAAAHYGRYLNGRPAIAFCCTVAHAEHVASAFRAQGWRAASVDGRMPEADREERLNGLANGTLNVLTSCELISEGVDVPAVAGAILLRPTKSLTMFLQQVGRALRPKPDGGRAVILDHVGNCHRHGLPDAPRGWSLEGRKKRAAGPGVRTCETCFAVVAKGDPVECDADPCPLQYEGGAGGGQTDPVEVDGELEAVADPLAWADGYDIRAARGRAWFELLELADTKEKLDMIARARGYKRGWVQHVLRERAGIGERRAA